MLKVLVFRTVFILFKELPAQILTNFSRWFNSLFVLYVSNCSMKDLELFSKNKTTMAKEKATFFNLSICQIKSKKWSQKQLSMRSFYLSLLQYSIESNKKNPHFTESYRRFLRYRQKKITVHVEFDTLNRQIGKEKESPYMLNLTALIAKSAKKRLS